MKEKEMKEVLISAVHRNRYEIEEEGTKKFATLKAGIYYSEKEKEEFPTVGDHVLVEINPIGDSQIIKTLPRKSKFSRKDPDDGMGEQVIAANFDTIFIMMSLNYDFNIKRLERYLTAAWESGGVPVILLTKADIATQKEEKMDMVRAAAPGVDLYCISGRTGEGVEELEKYLSPGRTVVFLGSSGVGKSTFTNFLLGDQIMETREIREDDSKGHHTTTYRQMFRLKNGSRIIDTPGMRELGMWSVEEGLDQSFSDIHELAETCRFRNCSHGKEPGCAIQEALESGTLSSVRWKSYNKIQKEARFQKNKEIRNQMREGKSVKRTERHWKQEE